MWRAVSGEPVNEMRRARGSATSAAPTSSPMPCTTFSTPGGQPRLVREVGEQRARERRPLGGLQDDGAARRERGRGLPGREHERRVPRRDHDRRAGRHADHPVRRAVRRPHGAPRSPRPARRSCGSCARRAGSRGHAASARASPCRGTRRGRGARRRARSGRRAAAGTARGPRDRAPPRRGTRRRRRRGRAPASGAPPRATSASSAQSIGEWSSKRSGDATRRPPM